MDYDEEMELLEKYPDLKEAWEQWSEADDLYLDALSETVSSSSKKITKTKDIMFKKFEEYEFLLKLIQDY